MAAALANPDRPCYRVLATESALPTIEPAARAPRDHAREGDGRADRAALATGGAAPGAGRWRWASCPSATPRELGADPAAASLVLALDQVSDPRNLGAILRTAAALGVEGVILPERRSAELGGACAKAASGALDLVPLVEVVNLGPHAGRAEAARLLDRRPGRGGPDIAGDPRPPPRVVLVLGSEGEGLRRLVAEQCDHLARLAIDPRMESLNVSVAAGIALYLLARKAS